MICRSARIDLQDWCGEWLYVMQQAMLKIFCEGCGEEEEQEEEKDVLSKLNNQ